MGNADDDLKRSLHRVVGALGDFESRLSSRDKLLVQFGMRAAHAEEALARGENDRGEAHLQKLVALARQIGVGG